MLAPGSESPASFAVPVSEPSPALDEELEAVTSTVASASKDVALLALAVAVSVIFSPADAASRTRTAARSASLWLVGRSPTVQTVPSAAEQTL